MARRTASTSVGSDDFAAARKDQTKAIARRLHRLKRFDERPHLESVAAVAIEHDTDIHGRTTTAVARGGLQGDLNEKTTRLAKAAPIGMEGNRESPARWRVERLDHRSCQKMRRQGLLCLCEPSCEEAYLGVSGNVAVRPIAARIAKAQAIECPARFEKRESGRLVALLLFDIELDRDVQDADVF